jgi:hypothetical protein
VVAVLAWFSLRVAVNMAFPCSGAVLGRVSPWGVLNQHFPAEKPLLA